MSLGRTYGARDPAEAVALVAAARRMLLLRVHRRRLRFEDLEDCYSQATLELVARARRSPFQSNTHIANALEQKFLSRIDDRRRAISGRSAIETALAGALPVDEPDGGAGELEDRGAEVLHQVARRFELERLREVVADLTEDQRLVLASQVTLNMDCAEFCARYGWSPDKYRKVGQRARARLRVLVDSHQSGERCRLLEPDLAAHAAGTLAPERAQRVVRHLANCRPCARQLQDLERASRQVAALLPPLQIGLLAKLGAALLAARRVFPLPNRGAAPPLGTAGAGGGALGAGGSLLGASVTKLGVAAACVAGAAGSLVICSHAGLIGGHHAGPTPHVHASSRRTVPAGAPLAGNLAPVRQANIEHARRRPGARDGSVRSSHGHLSGAAAAAQARREFGSAHAGAASIAGATAGPRGMPSGRTPAGHRGSGEFGFEH